MLSESQLATLKAAVDTVIPPDNTPGGWDAGVGDYLLRQFERDLKEVVGMYQQGLLALDAEAEIASGQSFADLTPDAREALLTKIGKGQVRTAWQTDPVSFVAMLVEHCAEGFYSDPGNGGNREGIAWKMIGFEAAKNDTK